MDEILERYKQGKFQKCLELIKLLPSSDNIVDSIVIQNCLLVVESVVKILKSNFQNAYEIEEKLYLFFDSVTSLNILDVNISLLLKLTATFNYFWWILFFNTSCTNIQKNELYLDKIYVGLIRVVGDYNKFSNFPYSTKSEKILNQLYKLKSLIKTENYFTSLLIVEIVVVVLLIIFKFNKEMLYNCTSVIGFFLLDINTIMNSNDFNDEHIKTFNIPKIFKFGLNKLTILLSETDFSSFNYLQLLESVFFFIVGNFEESLKLLEKNQNFSSFWSYLKALNFYNLNRQDQCIKYLKLISNLNVEPYLNLKVFILKGRLYCQNKNYKKSLKIFEQALNIEANSPLPYFYIGQQYGKMGLYELMTEWFEKLFKIFKDKKTKLCHDCNIEIFFLDCIHASDEINEIEVLYSLAISYGLNEKFNEASNIFEKILPHARNTDLLAKVNYIPNWLTVLHEASIANLLAGNLTRAEDIANDAIRQYSPRDISILFKDKKSFVYKDVHWLQKEIEEELLSNKISFKKLNPEFLYIEDFFFFLPENIIALLIKAEIQKIQKVDNYKVILKRIFSLLSNYIVLIVKKEKIDDSEKFICTIVKAFTSKICLWLINAHISNNNFIYIEKMFKRALGCNKGDKDVFYNYCDFLLKSGKIREALKLWNSYCKEKSSVPLECVQSLSLRYFLATKMSNKDIEKIQRKIQLSSI